MQLVANVETGLTAHPNNSLHGPKHQACRSYPAKILAHLKRLSVGTKIFPFSFVENGSHHARDDIRARGLGSALLLRLW